ncbi:lysozyme family protein [Catenibacterium mitsuokai]|uniref:lysozyme family protein n=1 Tax=Catenibacterium mitsuokai TaxID=100886 RepID=UPI001C037409|nr:lysozyme family protein [Catenibacterium mitsuokai]
MNQSIKTKNTVKDIKTVDRKQQLHHFVKKTNMRSKDNEKSNQLEESQNSYAINQVTKKEKATAMQTYQKGKQFHIKSKSKKIKSKKDEELNIKTGIEPVQEKKDKKKTIIHFKQTENIKKKNKLNMKLNRKNKFNSVKENHQFKPQYQMKAFHMKKHQQKIVDAKQEVNVLKRGISHIKSGVVKSYQTIRKTGKGVQLLISFGTGFLFITTVVLFFGVFGALAGDSGTHSATEPLSHEVLSYTTVIEKYAKQYDMSEYVPLIQAVMMQESGGKGTDPMQSSECSYNTKYDKKPNSIQDVEYSIDCGVHYLSDCLKEAKVSDPYDMSHISLALQGYNFGNGYIGWSVEHFGGYTRANAKVFSDDMKQKLGVNVYGDPDYVAHVLRYYHLGNGDIVAIAKTQVGNVGGKPYWQWYGFDSRVEWCAIFVSWCANESGQLNISIPKFSRVEDGIQWFKNKNQWKGRSYRPKSGDLIFFDWENDNDPDHVGIVERIDNKYVYTIEGNCNDECKQKKYFINSRVIFGYGKLKHTMIKY